MFNSTGRKNLILLAVITWLIVSFAVLAISAKRLDLYKYYYLMNFGEEVLGTVTNSQEDDLLITYEYQVDGAPYHDSFQATKRGSFLGKKMLITYDPANPSYHLAGDVKENFRGTFIVFLVIALIPTVMLIGTMVLIMNLRK